MKPTDLIVDGHDADDGGVWPHRLAQHVEVEQAVLLYREVRHVKAPLLQVPGGWGGAVERSGGRVSAFPHQDGRN